jgi:hypothetical protein
VAPEGDQELGPTPVAPYARETLLEPGAIDQASGRAARRRGERTVRGLEALPVHLLQGGEVIGHHAHQRRGLGAARPVGGGRRAAR